jgi:tetratricopeptide (TPR) repeat protein
MQRHEHTLILRREEHKRDSLGAVFLAAITDPDEIRRSVERYLGPSFTVRRVESDGATALRVRVECGRFLQESQNLSKIARSMAERGRPRAASEMFAEALKLDPLNIEALKGQGKLLAAAGDLVEAEERWIRAGEVDGYDGDILRALAGIALQADRRPTAIQYLEGALLANPEDAEAHAMLDELNRQTELRFAEQTHERDEKPGKG